MILSVITIGDFWRSTKEMIIPKTIGIIQTGHFLRKRLNRLLSAGHRLRGYEE